MIVTLEVSRKKTTPKIKLFETIGGSFGPEVGRSSERKPAVRTVNKTTKVQRSTG